MTSSWLPAAESPSPAAQRWSQIELRATVVTDGPIVPSTLDGFGTLVRQLAIGQHPAEEVWVAAVDGSQIRAISMTARGQYHAVQVALPAILAVPLLAGCAQLTVLHTHPSSVLTPSAEDIELTRLVAAAANTCGLLLADHLIVARDGRMASLRRLGHLV